MKEIATPHGPARAELHAGEGARALLVLGHGAGGGIGAPDLVAARDAALAAGVGVALVEQPYRVAGRRSPAPAAQLDAAWLAVLEALERPGPLLVGGRSSGARVAAAPRGRRAPRACSASRSRCIRRGSRRRRGWRSWRPSARPSDRAGRARPVRDAARRAGRRSSRPGHALAPRRGSPRRSRGRRPVLRYAARALDSPSATISSHDGAPVAFAVSRAAREPRRRPWRAPVAQRDGILTTRPCRAPMHYKRVIPCMDVDGGRVVKGTRFIDIRDAGDPVELAAFYDREGADELIFLDITATSDKRSDGRGARAAGRRRGVRPVHDRRRRARGRRRAGGARRGADKVSVNTAAVGRPALIGELAACSARSAWCSRSTRSGARTACGRSTSPAGATRPARTRSVGPRGRGARRGGDPAHLDGPRRDQGRLRPLAHAAISGAVDVPVIASGGVGAPEHMVDGLQAGADAVLAASIFHYGEHSVAEVKDAIAGAGIAVRR